MTFKRHYLLIILCLSAFQIQAQDVVFSQFYAAPLELNPALTGVTHSPRIIFNYRNQWPSIPQAYTTYAVSYDQYFERVNSGIGINIITDAEGGGIYQTNRIDFSYAYDLRIQGDLYLRGGLEASAVQRRIDWNRLTFLDELDPITGASNPIPTEELQPENLSRYYADFSAGLLAYSPKYYGGIAIKHLNAPNEQLLLTETDFAQRPVLYSLHAGADFDISGNNIGDRQAFISPNLLFTRQADFSQINVGAYVHSGFIFGGLWYRHTPTNADAAIFLLGFHKDMLKIGYSYDLTVSRLNSRTAGGHEISLTLNLDDSPAAQRRKRRRDINNCLKLFR